MINWIKNLFKGKTNWIVINSKLVGVDDLFTLDFDNNWCYSVEGNSFYSIHNEVDDIKGGIQISLIWDRPVIKQFGTFENFKSILEKQEKRRFEVVKLNNEDCLYLKTNYSNNNLDIYYWYIFKEDKISIKITYFIFEEQSENFKKETLIRVNRILNSIIFNYQNIENTKMK